MLKFPPIKQIPIPDTLFFKQTVKIPSESYFYKGANKNSFYKYTAIDKNGHKTGIMLTQPQTLQSNIEPLFFPGFKKIKSLYIEYIESYRHGTGEKLLKLAKSESEKQGCKGNIHLFATSKYKPSKPAQIFYRKCGLDSLDTFFIQDIDRYLKGKQSLKNIDIHDTTMYFKSKNSPSKKSGLSSAINKIKNYINKYFD